jgi:N-acetylmuramoyl-L-alanine amidase
MTGDFVLFVLFMLIFQMLMRRWMMMRRAGPSIFYTLILILISVGYPNKVLSDECSDMYKKTADKYYAYKKAGILDNISCRELMNSFRQINNIHPSCDKADDALYMVGMLGVRAHDSGGNKKDLEESVNAFLDLSKKYPESSLADDADYQVGEIRMMMDETDKAKEAFDKVISYNGDMNEKARERLLQISKIQLENTNEKKDAAAADPIKEMPKDDEVKEPEIPEDTGIDREKIKEIINSEKLLGKQEKETVETKAPVVEISKMENTSLDVDPNYAKLTSVRYWSNKDYTRIVIDLDKEVVYSPPHLLKPDLELKTAYRLFIDFKGAAVAQSMKNGVTPEAGCFTLPIGDGNLLKARAGQYLPDTARVVLDIETIDHFNAFPLPGDKFRYVIDVYGTPERNNIAINKPVISEKPGKEIPIRPIPVRAGKKTIIVLDAGHGGKDPGAVGPSGLKEKDITLALAKKAERIIEKKNPEIDVVLTRRTDKYISLVERTALANTIKADLFVSIHVNAAKNSKAYGIETYYLDNTTDRASLKLAAKENFVAEKVMTDEMSTTNKILADLITASKVEDSVPLARDIQVSLVKGLGKKYKGINDKGVKKAPFWVLTGATMPAVLAEVGFISNKTEEKRLRSSEYQQATAEAISNGILSYVDGYGAITLNSK